MRRVKDEVRDIRKKR